MNTMTVHDVQQGSPEWHALRAQHFCASEAAAMMGVSPYMTRSELLRQKATGIIPEVDAATQRRFDDGHATEAAFRPVVERIIGEDLYPVVGTLEYTGLPLLASFDGLTMDWQTGYEHKRINNDLRALRDGRLTRLNEDALEACVERVGLAVLGARVRHAEAAVLEDQLHHFVGVDLLRADGACPDLALVVAHAASSAPQPKAEREPVKVPMVADCAPVTATWMLPSTSPSKTAVLST